MHSDKAGSTGNDHWPQICHLVDSANAMPDQDMRGKVRTITTIVKSGAHVSASKCVGNMMAPCILACYPPARMLGR
ncbi:hypothetical protein BJA5080_01244 [Bradyrhizobium diazoefficiens SEMIA 5080]|uniref:Uncharacterized protein n=1 Tax=Bradyrhizobium diazoefficiens SEMIA 5080 TaxID=754504 RepID=A0A837CEW6_9BRAD|nr:hypothetical protein BJA5080_01244 [Bradyrhizobium diazoefficiens SEMIA 5080]